MDFKIKLAEKVIEIKDCDPRTKAFYKDYLTEDTVPDLSISLTGEDIPNSQVEAEAQTYSAQYLETLTVLRKIAEEFPSYNRFLMHGAAISFRDKAYLFTAPSGTGKSTHIRLWKKYLKAEVDIINGDKPILSIEKTPDEKRTEVRIYGTPWAGKEGWQKNRSAALHGICFINQSDKNTICPLKPEECLNMLIRQIYLPADPTAAGLTLSLMDALVQQIPLYMLHCNISEEAVKCSMEALTGLTYPI